MAPQERTADTSRAICAGNRAATQVGNLKVRRTRQTGVSHGRTGQGLGVGRLLSGEVDRLLEPLCVLHYHGGRDHGKGLVARKEPVAPCQEETLEPALAEVLAQDLHYPAVRCDVVVYGGASCRRSSGCRPRRRRRGGWSWSRPGRRAGSSPNRRGVSKCHAASRPGAGRTRGAPSPAPGMGQTERDEQGSK